MVQTTVPDAHDRGTDGERSTLEGVVASGRVALLGRLVDELVKRRENVIAELDLGNGRRTDTRQADTKAGDALLGEGRVEDTLLP